MIHYLQLGQKLPNKTKSSESSCAISKAATALSICLDSQTVIYYRRYIFDCNTTNNFFITRICIAA